MAFNPLAVSTELMKPVNQEIKMLSVDNTLIFSSVFFPLLAAAVLLLEQITAKDKYPVCSSEPYNFSSHQMDYISRYCDREGWLEYERRNNASDSLIGSISLVILPYYLCIQALVMYLPFLLWTSINSADLKYDLKMLSTEMDNIAESLMKRIKCFIKYLNENAESTEKMTEVIEKLRKSIESINEDEYSDKKKQFDTELSRISIGVEPDTKLPKQSLCDNIAALIKSSGEKYNCKYNAESTEKITEVIEDLRKSIESMSEDKYSDKKKQFDRKLSRFSIGVEPDTKLPKQSLCDNIAALIKSRGKKYKCKYIVVHAMYYLCWALILVGDIALMAFSNLPEVRESKCLYDSLKHGTIIIDCIYPLDGMYKVVLYCYFFVRILSIFVAIGSDIHYGICLATYDKCCVQKSTSSFSNIPYISKLEPTVYIFYSLFHVNRAFCLSYQTLEKWKLLLQYTTVGKLETLESKLAFLFIRQQNKQSQRKPGEQQDSQTMVKQLVGGSNTGRTIGDPSIEQEDVTIELDTMKATEDLNTMQEREA